MNLTPASLDHDKISVNALKVVHRLSEHGYQAYLVGGCIRDLLLGKAPKDFDIATDAHPEEIRDLFRNSRIIGRRFKIVHVRFGREIVEVTTFRGPHDDQYDENHSESGMTLNDNIYGTFEEDVFRRDFAMNAIYYDPGSEELRDLADGVTDIASKTIRTIGDPEKRFREDPVRMLRAVRFNAKLGFDIDTEVSDAIKSLGYLIQDVPPARLFEEVLKLFMAGYGAQSFGSLLENDLYGWLFPSSRRTMDSHPTEDIVQLALESTDRRIAEEKPVTPAFIYAAMLWYAFVDEKDKLQEEGMTQTDASHEAAGNVISQQQLFTSIPRRFTGPMRDIWFLQYRLPNRAGKKPDYLLQHKRFRAAYDFLLLREAVGEKTDQLGDWWTEFQEATGERRADMKKQSDGNKKRRRRRNRRRGSQPRTENTYPQ
jgi:poly(A) polymerase